MDICSNMWNEMLENCNCWVYFTLLAFYAVFAVHVLIFCTIVKMSLSHFRYSATWFVLVCMHKPLNLNVSMVGMNQTSDACWPILIPHLGCWRKERILGQGKKGRGLDISRLYYVKQGVRLLKYYRLYARMVVFRIVVDISCMRRHIWNISRSPDSRHIGIKSRRLGMRCIGK